MLLSERKQSEKATYDCMFPTIEHSGKDRTMKRVKRSVVARVQWGRVNSWSTEDFQDGESIPYNTAMMVQIVIRLSKSTGCINTTLRINQIVNVELWLVVLCQHRFVSCNMHRPGGGC